MAIEGIYSPDTPIVSSRARGSRAQRIIRARQIHAHKSSSQYRQAYRAGTARRRVSRVSSAVRRYQQRRSSQAARSRTINPRGSSTGRITQAEMAARVAARAQGNTGASLTSGATMDLGRLIAQIIREVIASVAR